MRAPAALETESHGDHVLVRIIGELDVANSDGMVAGIEAAVPIEAHGAILDLTAVGFLDSTAIRKLFTLATRLRARRQRILIVTPSGSTVSRTLQLVDFARAAPMHDTVDAALATLTSTGEGGAEA